MSSSRSLDIFHLIKSMTKSEKRAFKIFAKRGSGTQHLFLKLFDLIDDLKSPNDELILKKMKFDSVNQYSNLKRHLYTQILSSLRMLHVDKKPNIKIREYIDMAYVLYGKGLYIQALNILKTAKQLCEKYGTDLSLLTILEIEKTIHSRHITRIDSDTFEKLLTNTDQISNSLNDRVHLTNLKMNLHRMYIQDGHVKSETEYNQVTKYFEDQIKVMHYDQLGLMEKIFYCQCYVWYNYLIDNYNACLDYAITWVELFKSSEELIKRDYTLYLRGYHYVLTSAFNIDDFKTHNSYLEELETFRKTNYSKLNNVNKIFSFLYTHSGRFNNVFLSHKFGEGLKLIPNTLNRLRRYSNQLDHHKIMVLHYKIAWMYIGAGQAKEALPYLNGIIDLKRKSLREDIQSYARLMHLMALFDMEEYNLILDVLRKYKYYFEKAKEINSLQKASFKYFYMISTCPILEREKLHLEFYKELIIIKKNKFEKRAFLYLDIIYWVAKYI